MSFRRFMGSFVNRLEKLRGIAIARCSQSSNVSPITPPIFVMILPFLCVLSRLNRLGSWEVSSFGNRLRHHCPSTLSPGCYHHVRTK